MARRRHKYEKAPKFRGAAYLWLLIVLLVCASVWGVSARYIQQREQELLAQAKMFYFTSDLLTEENPTYKLNPDTAVVRFDIRNHIDALRFSEDNIQYDVYVNDVQLGQTAELTGNTVSKNTIEFSVSAGHTYTVRAEGSAGYTKEIYATFEVLESPAGFYKHVDATDENVVLLTVWTQDISGNVTVQFPAGLIPDATDSKLASVTNFSGSSYGAGETAPLALGAYESFTYRFFKETPGTNYTAGQFTVKMADGTEATEEKP